MELVTAKKLSYTVNTVILMLVFGLMGFFHICEVTFLTIFSIPTAMIYLIGYYLIKKERLALYVWAVYFWLTLYMGLTTICLGYGYGFHLYCFSMIPTMFVTEYISYKLNKKTMKIKSMNAIHISGAIAVFYLLCTGYVSIFGPIYNVRKNAATFFWIFNAVTVFGFLIFYSNYLIKSIKKSEDELTEMAHLDRLTQLYNRHYMMERLEALSDKTEESFLAMVDIDLFKKINDTYGHNGGDEVLKSLSALMQNECPECEISRWGGEEFLILSATPLSNGKAMLEKLNMKVASTPVGFDGQDIHVTITIGMAVRKSGQSVDLWIQEADEKLYYGKNNGRNRVVE